MSRHPVSKDFEDTGPLATPSYLWSNRSKHVPFQYIGNAHPSYWSRQKFLPIGHLSHLAAIHICSETPLERCIDNFGSDRIVC